MAAEEVLKFMQIQNRPFSANDVMQNIGKEHGKTNIQKALEKLVNQNKLFEKNYGKQKVYCIVQEDVDVINLDENLKKLDREINEVSVKLKANEDELQKNMAELSSMQKKMSNKEIEKSVADLKTEIIMLKGKLNDFSESATSLISDEEKLSISKQYEKYVKEYKKRKRICKEMIDTILEGYPKSKKHLVEEIGIETDEDVGFTFEEILFKK